MKKKISIWIATAFGAGLVPFAPGTAGSLVGLPIVYFTASWNLMPRVALYVALTIIGSWAAKVFDDFQGSKDNQHIVIDEVIGQGIAGWSVGTSFIGLLVAFIFFRVFDIFKFPPVRQLDRWSKHQSGAWAGFGVIADDILAGFQGLIVVLVLQHFHVLPN